MQINDRYKKARPHLIRSAAAFVVGVIGFSMATAMGQLKDKHVDPGPPPTNPATPTEQAIAVVGALVVLGAGVAAVRTVASAIRSTADEPGEGQRTGPLALIVSIFGYLIVLLATLGAVGVPLGKVLLGGALTGVILGIAAQQSLGNFFAGLVLLLVRPFTVGETVIMKSGAIGGEYQGVVTEMSMFYVRMVTDQGPVLLPNAGVLAAAIGPGAATPKEEEEELDEGERPEEVESTEELDPGPQHGGTPAAP
jgi:small-conductance mechanosensitive channel